MAGRQLEIPDEEQAYEQPREHFAVVPYPCLTNSCPRSQEGLLVRLQKSHLFLRKMRDGAWKSALRWRQAIYYLQVIHKPDHPGESVGEKLSSNVESMTYGQFDVAKSL